MHICFGWSSQSQECDVYRAAVNNQQDRHHSLRQAACLTFSTMTEACCVGLSVGLSADSLSNKLYEECKMKQSVFHHFHLQIIRFTNEEKDDTDENDSGHISAASYHCCHIFHSLVISFAFWKPSWRHKTLTHLFILSSFLPYIHCFFSFLANSC